MKKLIVFSVLASGILMFSFRQNTDNLCSTTSSGSKSITCGSCHGGSINNDIIIVNGQEEEDVIPVSDNPRLIRLIVKMPDYVNSSAVQLSASDQKENQFTFSGIKPLIKDSHAAVSALIFTGKDNGKKENSVEIFWEAPEKFDSPQTIEVQGVLANLDGTDAGDYSFFKEVVVYPKVSLAEAKLSIYPSIARDFLHVDGLQDDSRLVICDISGKQVKVCDKTIGSQVDISELNNGSYFAVLESGKLVQTAKFIVSK